MLENKVLFNIIEKTIKLGYKIEFEMISTQIIVRLSLVNKNVHIQQVVPSYYLQKTQKLNKLINFMITKLTDNENIRS